MMLWSAPAGRPEPARKDSRVWDKGRGFPILMSVYSGSEKNIKNSESWGELL